MPMPSKEKLAKQNTMDDLLNRCVDNGLVQKFYKDQIDQYMLFYDDLEMLNKQLKSGKLDLTAYRATVAEKRRITTEMRSILIFLGLKPPEMPPQTTDNDEL